MGQGAWGGLNTRSVAVILEGAKCGKQLDRLANLLPFDGIVQGDCESHEGPAAMRMAQAYRYDRLGKRIVGRRSLSDRLCSRVEGRGAV